MRWLTHNFWLKMLSLALAFTFSSYIYYEVDYPIPESVFLPLEVRNLTPELILLEKLPSTIEVQVRGPYRSISHLNAQDHPAIVDFSGIVAAGPATVDVQLPSLGDVVITGQATDRFKVELDEAAKRSLPLVVWHTGELDPAFLLSNERTGERNVRLEGPKQLVDHVAIARLEPDLGELSAGLESSGDSLTATLQVRLYDADNNPVTNPTLKVSPEKVDYTADLKPVGDFKVLRVVPDFRGTPAPGYLVVAAEPDPHYVPVAPDATGEEVFAVRTEPIDISGAKVDFDRKVKLRYPLAVAASKPGIEECTVHFLIRKIAEEEGQFPISVELEGKQSGFEYILVPSAVRFAQGSKGSLTRQHLDAVRAKLDVSELGQGVYQVAPQLELPLHFNSIRISPPSLRLTILRPAEGGE